MKLNLAIALLLAIVTPSVVLAQATDFQTGKILTVQKVESASPAGGTDAPAAANKQKYDLTIQVNDQVYVCRGETSGNNELGWAEGKEVPVKVQGKVLAVKRANGKIVKLPILSTKKPS